MAQREEEEYEVEEQQYVSQEDILSAQSISAQDVMEHITGPVISVIVHVVLIALLGTIIVFDPAEQREEIEVNVEEVEVKELEKIPEPPKPPEEVEVDIVEIDRPDVQTDAVDVEVEDVAVEDAVIDVQMPDLLNVKPSDSALKLPGVYAMRSGSGRKKAIKMYGGNARSERHVTKALGWLAKVQKEDGAWGEGGISPAMTALATLAFLAHGETPQSQDYGPTVLKAIKKLIEFQGRMRDNSNSYINGMTTYALSEAYALTKIPMVEKAMNQGVAIIVKGLNTNGSFNYNYNNKPQQPRKDPKTGKIIVNKYIGEPRSDLSVAGWNYQALKAAFSAGCTVEGLEDTIDKAIEVGLKKSHYNKSSGGFSYSGGKIGGGGVSPTMANVGTLCLQLFGAGKSSQARRGLKWVETTGEGRLMVCEWKRSPARWALYQWYYQTQAIFQGHNGKGKSWRKWNREFTKALMREQAREGYWLSPLAKYHRPKKGDKPTHGENEHCFKTDMNLKVYCTALCTLMLEVYYRYLPTFKVVKDHKTNMDGFDLEDEDDDLGLKID